VSAAELLATLPAGLPVGEGWVIPGRTAPVVFPYDGSRVADAPLGDVSVAEAALAAASGHVPAAAAMPTHERRRVLFAAALALKERSEALAELLVLETGKPLLDCRTEVARTIVTFETAAEEAARLTGETVALDLLPAGEGMLGFWVRRPIGVVVGVTGFNYPLLLAAHKVAPALGAGCPVIVKPAPATPLATLVLVALLRGVGCPCAAVQLVTGDAEVGWFLTTDARTAAVSFTGSAEVGHRIASSVGAKKVVLELGSNAALVVTASADLERAADAVVRGGFYASGQACISVQRVVVDSSVLEPFLKLLEPRVAEVVTGDPREEKTRVSALIDGRSTQRVGEWVDQAVAAGARVVVGGRGADGAVEPTLLADVPDGALCWDEEIFGPVVCVRGVRGLDEAMDVVNRSRYGLHASVFTADLATALDAAARIEAGGVLINEVPGFRADNMPYGGVKDSGVGREGPRFAMEEFTVTKMVMIRP
jgi:acyl-CoA reductase-like NAD-dependent aldehyde dehydrogenase